MGRVEVTIPRLTSMWCSWVPSAAMMKWVPASFKVSLTTTAWAASPGRSSLWAEEGGVRQRSRRGWRATGVPSPRKASTE